MASRPQHPSPLRASVGDIRIRPLLSRYTLNAGTSTQARFCQD